MSKTTTPMMAQYRHARAGLSPDTILFFRLGDFYEMFFDDAREASRILDIALTQRQGVPMCGVPYHAADAYLAKLLRAGRKVALCDQIEDPAVARGIVRREVTRVITPGSILEERALETQRNNYMAAVHVHDSRFGLAVLDPSTGSFAVEETENVAALRDSLARFAPAECLVAEGARERLNEAVKAMPSVTVRDDWMFDPDNARDELLRLFRVHSLDGYGCEALRAAVGAAGAMARYVRDELRLPLGHVTRLRVRRSAEDLMLDETTLTNLDLLSARVAAPGGAPASLLGVLDATCTPMGGRLLRDWLTRPSADVSCIRARHDAVEGWVNDRPGLQALRETLSSIRDMERGLARLSAGGGGPRDVQAVGASLRALPIVSGQVERQAAERVVALRNALNPLPDLASLIERALVDEPPVSLRDGGFIRKGYHAELDGLRGAAHEGRDWLAEFQAREQERTGIKTLKVRYNKVFGYYIEISKGQAGQAPAEYARKQTLVNAERFTTPELKTYEQTILGAQDRALALEQELFQALREAVTAETEAIQENARAVAELDVLAALAERAVALRYTRPVVDDSLTLDIRNGRHPVIEGLPEAERFVPNDTRLDGDRRRLAIITGPNMAGKSTYIRQVALIAIMAHAGSFVPADSAHIGRLDRVFTRVGAGDDLVRGRSTFMVEMQETANILNNATPRSLIVLDEIGRGTSTFDGISIAWAVAEYLHNREDVRAKTLFATHYHELTDLVHTLSGAQNYNVLVSEQGDRIAFLRRIVPGAADKSYGIHVAQLAGLPAEVVDRAKEILANLEEGEWSEAGQPKLARRRARKPAAPEQLNLFERSPA